MLEKLKQSFKGMNKLDVIWLLIANIIILGLSLYWGDGPIAIISAMTGITCTVLISNKLVANYYFGIINVALYAYLSYQSKLYGDAMLNAFYYFPMQFVGIYMWKKNKSDNGEVEARALTAKQKVMLALVSIVAIVIYSLFLKFLGGNIPLIDSASTILSVIAMILMVKQYLEQWYLWIIVNTVSIIMWAVSLSQGSGEFATLLMWILYLLNSLYGLYKWKVANKK